MSRARLEGKAIADRLVVAADGWRCRVTIADADVSQDCLTIQFVGEVPVAVTLLRCDAKSDTYVVKDAVAMRILFSRAIAVANLRHVEGEST